MIVTDPSVFSVASTFPTGVSILCVPGRNRAEILERFDKADRAMPAHSEIADIVEIDNTCGGITIYGFAEQRTDHGVVPARFADDRRPQLVVVAPKCVETFGHRAAAEIGKSVNDDPGRLAAGMRVDSSEIELAEFIYVRRTIRNIALSARPLKSSRGASLKEVETEHSASKNENRIDTSSDLSGA